MLVNNSLQVDIMSGFAFDLDVIRLMCRGKGFCDKVFILSVYLEKENWWEAEKV